MVPYRNALGFLFSTGNVVWRPRSKCRIASSHFPSSIPAGALNGKAEVGWKGSYTYCSTLHALTKIGVLNRSASLIEFFLSVSLETLENFTVSQLSVL
jgi:hypothetical protein